VLQLALPSFRLTSKLAGSTARSLILLALCAAGAFADDGLDELGAYQHLNFNLGAGSTDVARACAAQSDGKVLLAGSASTSDELSEIAVARLGTGSVLDASFGAAYGTPGVVVVDLTDNGIQGHQGQARAMAIDPQGRIVVAGSLILNSTGASIGFVMRLLPDGWIDPTFAINGFYLDFSMNLGVAALGLDAGGRVWLLGRSSADGTGPWVLTRLDSVGNYDGGGTVAFPALGFDSTFPTALLFDPNGKLLLGGYGRTPSPAYHAAMLVARLQAGSLSALDSTFGTAGRLVIDDFDSAFLRSIALQPNGRIVFGGEYGSTNNEESLVVYGSDADGHLFPGGFGEYFAFNFDGIPGGAGGGNNRMVVQSDGKILVAAAAFTGHVENITNTGVARVLSTSGLDTSFGGLGTGKHRTDLPPLLNQSEDGSSMFSCLTLAAGKPVLVGSAHASGSDWDFAYRRLSSDLIYTDGFEVGTSFFWSGKTQ